MDNKVVKLDFSSLMYNDDNSNFLHDLFRSIELSRFGLIEERFVESLEEGDWKKGTLENDLIKLDILELWKDLGTRDVELDSRSGTSIPRRIKGKIAIPLANGYLVYLEVSGGY